VTVGDKLSLGFGLAALGGAAAIAVGHGDRTGVFILAILGASSLSGFIKSRRARR
jgi:hypothetical protein